MPEIAADLISTCSGLFPETGIGQSQQLGPDVNRPRARAHAGGAAAEREMAGRGWPEPRAANSLLSRKNFPVLREFGRPTAMTEARATGTGRAAAPSFRGLFYRCAKSRCISAAFCSGPESRWNRRFQSDFHLGLADATPAVAWRRAKARFTPGGPGERCARSSVRIGMEMRLLKVRCRY